MLALKPVSYDTQILWKALGTHLYAQALALSLLVSVRIDESAPKPVYI